MNKEKTVIMKEFDILIDKLKAEQETPDRYSYLPDILSILTNMHNELKTSLPNKQKRSNHIGAIGYLILDDMSFAESPLGEEIVALINKYDQLD